MTPQIAAVLLRYQVFVSRICHSSSPIFSTIQLLLAAIEKGLEIEVSRTFSMSNAREAYEFAERGGFIGKVAFDLP